MENKLQQAKDTIAKKYGYESFEEIPYTHISSINVRYENYQDIINDVAIEYNRLCNEWINVDERLPEIDVSVITFPYSMVTIRHMKMDGKDKVWFSDALPVTHWMPLPQPPIS